MTCRDELENEFLGVLKENLRIGIVCKCAVSAHGKSVTLVCTRLHAALDYMHVTRGCSLQGCEDETLAECYAYAGRDSHFGQMCFGRFDFRLNVEERFDAFLSEDSEICFRVKMSVSFFRAYS